MDRVLVIGGGGWGTALALVLDERGVDVSLWCHDSEYGEQIRRTRRNPRYLPGIELPESVEVTSDVNVATRCSVAFSVVPSQYLREVMQGFVGVIPAGRLMVSATKGIEHGTLRSPTSILKELFPTAPMVVLSGPSHAEEVARRMPTTVVAAARDSGHALRIQDLLHTQFFRVYSSADPIGVELGGALKNVISIAGGIVDGLGFGDNTKAALLTRGIVEMARLGQAMGAQRETFFGLSGIGDLITSCISPHGRNRQVGSRIGRGERLADIVESMHQVAEGVRTANAVHDVAANLEIEMPICEEVFRVLYEDKDPSKAVQDLMTRQLKEETQW